MTSKEKQELVLEYIKTTAVVIGVIFGLIQLNAIRTEDARIKVENTSQALNAFAKPELIRSAVAMIGARKLPKSNETYISLLADLTPLSQHLQNWAACIAMELCESEKSFRAFCRKLLNYESEFEKIQIHFSRFYDASDRNEVFWDQIIQCKEKHPDSVIR